MSVLMLFILSQAVAIAIVVAILGGVLNRMLLDLGVKYFELWRPAEDDQPPGRVAVITARPLDEKRRRKISASVEKRFPENVDLCFEQCPQQWGGMIVKTDQQVFDFSLRDRLRKGFHIG
ncbi:MAG: F0F1 ATP synthase subunit delta [Candidatus Omnitrophota bacterium]